MAEEQAVHATEHKGFKHIGGVLCKARRAKKLKFPQITEAIRVREEHLRAMEDGAFEMLPGGVYTRSHLKSYADYLGLDAAPLLEELDKELGNITPAEEVSLAPEPYRSSFSPGVWIIILSLAAAGMVYAYWQQTHHLPPPPVNEHQQKVTQLYTAPAPQIAIMAVGEVQVKVIGPKGGVLLDKLLQDGDVFYVPKDKEVTLFSSDLTLMALYVEGQEVMSRTNLELREGGLVLNREKLLANIAIQ